MAKESLLTVIVRRGTLVFEGIDHAIGAEIKLLESEARRLIGLGVVALPEVKPAPTAAPAGGLTATSADGPSVTTAQE